MGRGEVGWVGVVMGEGGVGCVWWSWYDVLVCLGLM